MFELSPVSRNSSSNTQKDQVGESFNDLLSETVARMFVQEHRADQQNMSFGVGVSLVSRNFCTLALKGLSSVWS